MLRISFLSILIGASLCAHGQEIIPDSTHNALDRIIQRRAEAENFSATIHRLGDPSVVSCFGNDFHLNTNPSLQKKQFVLNATIQPIVSLGGKRWYYKNLIHGLQAIPSISIRIFRNDSSKNDHSSPVRTPSFSTKLAYFFTFRQLWNDSLKHKVYFSITMGHHSNGQDGYEFIDGKTGWPVAMNTYNGNFSELAIGELIGGGIHHVQRPIPIEKQRTKVKSPRAIQYGSRDFDVFWKTIYEVHPHISTNPKFDKYDLLGRHRMHYQLGYLLRPKMRNVVYSSSQKDWVPLETGYVSREVRRVVLNLSYIVDLNLNTGPLDNLRSVPMTGIDKRMNIDLTWYERIGTTQDYAVFMRLGYYGSDPYNIYFQESLWIARVGLAFGCFASGEKK